MASSLFAVIGDCQKAQHADHNLKENFGGLAKRGIPADGKMISMTKLISNSTWRIKGDPIPAE